MQDYHPVLRQGLTPRENYAMLIETVSAAFPRRKIQIHFDCPDDLFLVAPYDMLIFRIIRELLINIQAFRRDQAKISLSQEKSRIRLSAGDNGSFSPPDSELSSPRDTKGLSPYRIAFLHLEAPYQSVPASLQVLKYELNFP